MQYSVHTAKTHLSKLIEAVERGERVVITKHDRPVVELVKATEGGVRIGSLKGKVAPPDDAFFEPISEDELRDWGAI